LLTGSSPASM